MMNDNKNKDDVIATLSSQMEALKLNQGRHCETEVSRDKLQKELDSMTTKYQSLEQKYTSELKELTTKAA